MAQQTHRHSPEAWSSKLGVILAVAGSAVGLGNFLRFPGQVAANGGGAFMIPYFISFLVVGIPICWAEWAMGRYGGRFGFNSAPGIFSILWRHPLAKYFGALGLLIPVIIYMYYVYIESWCLAYAWYYLTGDLDLGRNPALYNAFFTHYTGMQEHGAVFKDGSQAAFWFFLLVFLINFLFIYRGLSRGIETFCKIAMPMLILAAVIIALRVLTLPEQPMPQPWQESLPQALPESEWQKLQALALNPETMPEGFKAAVEKTIGEHLRRQLHFAGPEKPNAMVLPPSGFAKSQAAYALDMAELRAADAHQRLQAWLKSEPARISEEAKSELRKLELQELKLDGEALIIHRSVPRLTDSGATCCPSRPRPTWNASSNPCGRSRARPNTAIPDICCCGKRHSSWLSNPGPLPTDSATCGIRTLKNSRIRRYGWRPRGKSSFRCRSVSASC